MMKIYEVKYTPIDINGWEQEMQVARRFDSMEKAVNYVEEQEKLWQENTDNGEIVSPCWYDRKKELSIEEVDVY